MALVAFWFLCGLVTAVMASNKGKDGFGWFVIGVLLGPFGIILAAATPADSKGLEHIQLAQGDSRKCPVCAELVKREAIKCRFCGTDLEPLRSTPPNAAHFTGRFNCSGCNTGKPLEGSQIVGGLRLCSGCAAGQPEKAGK
jgi:hypothetical protein